MKVHRIAGPALAVLITHGANAQSADCPTPANKSAAVSELRADVVKLAALACNAQGENAGKKCNELTAILTKDEHDLRPLQAAIQKFIDGQPNASKEERDAAADQLSTILDKRFIALAPALDALAKPAFSQAFSNKTGLWGNEGTYEVICNGIKDPNFFSQVKLFSSGTTDTTAPAVDKK